MSYDYTVNNMKLVAFAISFEKRLRDALKGIYSVKFQQFDFEFNKNVKFKIKFPHSVSHLKKSNLKILMFLSWSLFSLSCQIFTQKIIIILVSSEEWRKKIIWLFIVEQAVNEGLKERCTQKVINVLYRSTEDHKNVHIVCSTWWFMEHHHQTKKETERERRVKVNVINLQGVKGWSESPQKPCLMKFKWRS